MYWWGRTDPFPRYQKHLEDKLFGDLSCRVTAVTLLFNKLRPAFCLSVLLFSVFNSETMKSTAPAQKTNGTAEEGSCFHWKRSSPPSSLSSGTLGMCCLYSCAPSLRLSWKNVSMFSQQPIRRYTAGQCAETKRLSGCQPCVGRLSMSSGEHCTRWRVRPELCSAVCWGGVAVAALMHSLWLWSQDQDSHLFSTMEKRLTPPLAEELLAN